MLKRSLQLICQPLGGEQTPVLLHLVLQKLVLIIKKLQVQGQWRTMFYGSEAFKGEKSQSAHRMLFSLCPERNIKSWPIRGQKSAFCTGSSKTGALFLSQTLIQPESRENLAGTHSPPSDSLFSDPKSCAPEQLPLLLAVRSGMRGVGLSTQAIWPTLVWNHLCLRGKSLQRDQAQLSIEFCLEILAFFCLFLPYLCWSPSTTQREGVLHTLSQSFLTITLYHTGIQVC